MFGDIVEIMQRRFLARGIDSVEIVGGVDSRNETDNYGSGGSWRVAFVPPKEDGSFGPPILIGEEDDGSPRQLHTMRCPLDVFCAARDENHPDNDLANRERCIALWQVVAQELQDEYAGNYDLGKFGFDNDRKLGRFGAELVVRVVFNIPISDAPSALAKPKGAIGNSEENPL